MYRYFLSFMMLFLISCQENENQQLPSFPEGTVGFRAHTSQTRGAPLGQLSEVVDFQVVAYQHSGLWSSVSASAPASVFMNHVSVIQNVDNNLWSYSPLRYWPSEDNLTFFAYSPQAAMDGVPNQSGLTVTTPTDGSAPVITYTVPAKVEDQPDLLVSTAPNYNLNRQNNGVSGVNMELAHALTCVGFNATGEGERIIGVKVSGVIGVGSLTLGGQTIVWDIDPLATTYEFDAGVNLEPLDGNPSSILNGDGYLMMIPQTLTDQAKLTLTIDGGAALPYEQTFSLNVAGNGIWEAGRFIEYNFVVTPTTTILLTPESLVLTALANSSSSFTVICPDNAPNAEWTVTVPSGGWLEICDNMTGTNQIPQADPYTYSGQGTQKLFAFAPAANTSSAEILSTITLEGSVQKISVKKLYQDEIYVPEYPHGGWAGSNIYWVVDSNYPDGGYLTFDDKEVTTHEQYQGVYFMWGSLVALSPLGNSWTGGVWNGTSGQILYIPNKNAGTNGGWNPAVNTAWGYIPRLGWTNPSNPANTGSAVSLPFNDKQSYLIQGHNPLGNVGDICKYITDMGWAPGAEDGRKWRMPTHLEYLDLNDYARSTNGFFPYQQSTNRFGQATYTHGYRRIAGDGTPFFPASGYRTALFGLNGGLDNGNGYRPGEALSYWTSSPRVNNGDALDYVQIQTIDKIPTAKPTNTQGFQRNTGSTIRCVLENSR